MFNSSCRKRHWNIFSRFYKLITSNSVTLSLSTFIINLRCNMKSLSYTLAVLLPLASQLVVAMPGAEPDVGYLEEKNKGSDWGYKNHHGDDDHHEYDNQNVCEVKYPYPYYKYPCDSSPSNGTSILGATFTSFCKYQWVLNHSQFPLGLLTKVIETPILESGTALQKDGSRKTISLESAVCNLLLTDTRKYTNRNLAGATNPCPV